MDKAEIIRSFFRADPAAGAVWWADRAPVEMYQHKGWVEVFNRKRAGRPVKFGALPSRHLVVNVQARGRTVRCLAHRIIWAAAHGTYPGCDLDHINNDPTDNRLANLRLATRSQNLSNATRRKSGLKGAYWSGSRWFSMVWDGSRLRHLGTFATEAEAHAAWCRAKIEIAGPFFNPGYASVFD